jgi:hypothetical protein
MTKDDANYWLRENARRRAAARAPTATEGDERRRAGIRAMFAERRSAYPSWSHTELTRLVWARRPPGTNVYEVLAIAEEFRLPDAAPREEVALGGLSSA